MGTDDFKYQEAIFCYGSLAKYSRGMPFLPNLSQGDVSPPAPPRPPLFCVHRGGQGVSVGPCVVVAVSKQFHVGAGSPLLPYKGKGGRRLSPRCLSTVGPCDCVTATSLAQNDLEGDVIHLSLRKHRHPAWLPWFFPPSFLGGAAEMLPRARCADAAGSVCPSPSPGPSRGSISWKVYTCLATGSKVLPTQSSPPSRGGGQS